MYTNRNFKTKKDLREAFARGEKIGTYQPGGYFGGKTDGTITLEGPHYPAPHTWYATAIIADGNITLLEGKKPEQVKAQLDKAEAKKGPAKQPTMATLRKWLRDGTGKATDGCLVENDGYCEHGKPAWMLEMGLI